MKPTESDMKAARAFVSHHDIRGHGSCARLIDIISEAMQPEREAAERLDRVLANSSRRGGAD